MFLSTKKHKMTQKYVVTMPGLHVVMYKNENTQKFRKQDLGQSLKNLNTRKKMKMI